MDKLLLKNRILLILVIVLFLLNVTTIATIVWQTKKISRYDRFPFKGKLSGPRNFQQYVIDKLKLDPGQANAYLIADSVFRERSKDIFADMQQLRKLMVEEILKPNPDTIRLNMLSQQLAIEHIRLKSNTFDFLLRLKKICTPEQQAILSEHIRRMLEFEGMPPFGKGYRGGGKHRQVDQCESPRSHGKKPLPEDMPAAEQ